jgi:hypothetical protein
MLFDFLIICDNNENTIKDAILSALDEVKRRKAGNVFIVDNASTDNSWQVISKLMMEEQVANRTYCCALRNDYKVSDLQILLSYAPMATENSFIGILRGTSTLYEGGLQFIDTYVKTPFEVVGILYGDYVKWYDNLSVNIHQFSFDTNPPILDGSVFVNSEVLKKVSLQNEKTLSDLYKSVSSKFLAIHVPKILTVER